MVMIALGFLPFLAASYGATLLPATIVNDLEAGRPFRVLALHIVVLCGGCRKTRPRALYCPGFSD